MSSTIKEYDFDSPGFEYLRSYQNTINLYNKLVALNYQNEFCSLYKCPAINKYYFSMPSDNTNEQQFTFLCLCAWLIKHKCQMNFQLEPEDYEDTNTTIETILEAIRLLQADGNEPLTGAAFNAWLGFPPSRLKNASYGPEIVWIMNVLADRALELQRAEQRQQQARLSSTTISNNNPAANQRKSSLRVIYRSDQQTPAAAPAAAAAASSVNSNSNKQLDCITIGQPLVGGGLTTRPLGTYRIDDDALVFRNADLDDFWNGDRKTTKTNKRKTTTTATKGENARVLINNRDDDNDDDDFKPLSGDAASEWYRQVGLVASHLETIDLSHDNNNQDNDYTTRDWKSYLDTFERAKATIELFFKDSREPLESVAARVRRELQVIWAREKFIQTQASKEIDDYLSKYRKYSQLMKFNNELESSVEKKMASFEYMNEKLRNTRELVEKRTRDLSEGKHLRELEAKINQLREEKSQFNVKIGLLLSLYANKQTQLLNEINNNNNNDQNA